jgi:hypothetical protein
MNKEKLIEFLQACDSNTVLVRQEDGLVPITCGWVADDANVSEKIIILEI